MHLEFTDYLIIGGGVAGLRAAIELAPYGDVIVVTKDLPTESSTEYAQGGIAVALSDEDEVGIHYEDTLRAGDGLCNEEAVRVLVEEGPLRIMELIEWGALFDMEGSKLAFTREGAHSKKRVLHAHGDATGKELERVLLNKVKTYENVRRYSYAFALDLIIKDNECLGAYLLTDEGIKTVLSRSVILATGGAGQIYERTTNPQVATSDGMAIAFRGGAIVEDMEFVQFHPTSLYKEGAPNFLLSEAMRGEGAILRNKEGVAFMDSYHPMAELAPRDVVSRAIVSEMVKTGSEYVYLDLRHLDPEFIKKRFPRIYSTCMLYGIDITTTEIPVTPAAHYIMGGVKTDIHGRTNINGLLSAGEVACTGVHGANRLASNSLLEGLVYGARAGRTAFMVGKNREIPSLKEIDEPSYDDTIRGHETIRSELRRMMWQKAGIIRCGESLKEMEEWLIKWKDIMRCRPRTRPENELRNMLIVSLLIVRSALKRRGSIGAHYRTDFPERGTKWKRHISMSKESQEFDFL